MPSSSAPSGVLQFGVFEVDLRSRELRKAGTRVKLHDQPFQVLAMLLEHPGELVTREEIRQKLWPGDTFVDFDHGLNNAVNRLREAIGDSADSPRFVETLPRRGYRFITPVNVSRPAQIATFSEPHSVEVVAEQNVIAIPAKHRNTWPKASHLWIFLAPVALSLGLLISFRPWRIADQPSRRLFVLPPEGTTFQLIRDDGSAIALSPDGTKLAFSAIDVKGVARIWLRPLGSLVAQALDDTEGATFPFWSPDGRSIAFFSDSDEKLKKVSLRGGAAVALCDAPHGRGGSWSSRGIIVFAPNVQSGLYKISDSGGMPTSVTNVDTLIHTTHRWPKFLPDGRHFVYLAANHFRDASHNGVYLGSLESSERKLLVPTNADATYASGYLFFLRKNEFVAQPFDPDRARLMGEPRSTVEKVLYDASIWKAVFDVSDKGVMAYQLGSTVSGTQLRWFDRSGKQLGGVGGVAFQGEPRLSPDGRKLLIGRVASFGSYCDLWVYDLTRGVGTRITFEDYDYPGGIWSQDGKRVVFHARGPHYSLYETDASGAGKKRSLLDTGVDLTALDMSSDGRFLLYDQGNETEPERTRLWLYPMSGDGAPFPLLAAEAHQNSGRFSPDGLRVAYTSNESGKEEVYVASVQRPSRSIERRGEETNGKLQISPSGGHQPRWRRDGKELYYIAEDGTLMSVPITIRKSKFEVGVARPLFRPNTGTTTMGPYDVSPDGSKFIFNIGRPAETTAPITLVENWLSDLRN